MSRAATHATAYDHVLLTRAEKMQERLAHQRLDVPAGHGAVDLLPPQRWKKG